MSDLSRENLLDHAQNMRHRGLLEQPNFEHTEHSPTCGDWLHLTLRIDDTGIIREVGWDSGGCAISQACRVHARLSLALVWSMETSHDPVLAIAALLPYAGSLRDGIGRLRSIGSSAAKVINNSPYARWLGKYAPELENGKETIMDAYIVLDSNLGIVAVPRSEYSKFFMYDDKLSRLAIAEVIPEQRFEIWN